MAVDGRTLGRKKDDESSRVYILAFADPGLFAADILPGLYGCFGQESYD